MKRAQWLQQTHPKVRVLAIEDTKLKDDDSEGWAKFTLDILGYIPDAVFTSESYGDPYAKFLGTVHVLVDRDRTHIPISVTLVRSNPIKYAEFLKNCVRAHFAKRIAVLGAESTGTTTLSMALAQHYKTVWVPEYGRLYSSGKVQVNKYSDWRSGEFMHIAEVQNLLEDTLAEASNGLVICDTNAFATAVWHERFMGKPLQELEQQAVNRKYDLYILTGDEIPFVQDGLRDGEHIRHQMQQRFRLRLREANLPFLEVRGAKEKRLAAAIAAIDAV